MKVRFLGVHNTESRQAKMAAILVDDVLALDAGGLTASLSFRAQMKLKALLITHQHYDHVRDLPGLAMTFFLRGASLNVFGPLPVFNALKTQLFDGSLYPDFFEARGGRRALLYHRTEPHQRIVVEEYAVVAVPVAHSVPAVGYQITAKGGETVFYTGDTGPGLYEVWRHLSPHVIIAEVTSPNRYEDVARESGHLTPSLLGGELTTFKAVKGYLPRVVAVHMNPELELETGREVRAVANKLDVEIVLAHEGMEISLPGR